MAHIFLSTILTQLTLVLSIQYVPWHDLDLTDKKYTQFDVPDEAIPWGYDEKDIFNRLL
jgi:hypothetical protein